ncbi:hypothetical protein [Paenibacillus sp. BR1-192]|uniref:hypothetical protein n=1 Tax=Paenibacillus sp. BR1-192 TaxID=3032287 RepID=UPI00240DF5C5|nr:hypothetical protein [Paenibacillus sp. BR1-192]WFB60598.1 hypothetical protein P0X86_10495 [Paenibacillus sp. BR1-192]
MLEEWLSIAEERKLNEAVESCESHTDDLYRELVEHLEEIKEKKPELSEVANSIENLFIIKTRRDVNYIFPAAIQVGIQIGKRIK